MGQTNDNYNDYQQFLDQVQYTEQGLKRYEWIFGEDYLSTGGLETTKEIIPKLGLQRGQRVLDVGSGLGGHDFYMAQKYGVYIDAVDLSQNMMNMAVAKLANKKDIQDQINFRLADVTTTEFPANYYDAIYSRDALLHIKDKAKLFANFAKWLKPGGRVVFSDYIRGGRQPSSDEFKEYVKQRDYTLFTRDEYEKTIKEAGFVNVEVVDNGHKFVESLQRELAKLRDGRDEFLSRFGQADYDALERGWVAKLKRSEDGDQSWVLAVAYKPL